MKDFTDDSFGSKDPIFRKEVGEYKTLTEQMTLKKEFDSNARLLAGKHLNQTEETVLFLRDESRKPFLGNVTVLDAMRRLAECIDTTDTELYTTNQLMHSLQVAEGMEADGVTDETLILAGLIHDIGKIAELAGFPPELINCANEPISGVVNGGLDQAIITWNHDECAYQKLKDVVPDHVGWLLRYHSLRFEKAAPYMDQRDRDYFDKYLEDFRNYDLGTKSTFHVPRKRLDDYKPLFDKYFPEKLAL